MAEVVVDEEETIVDSPLPIGLAEAGLLLLLLGTMTVSKWEDGDADDAVCSNGDGVMFARVGCCPIGVIDRPEPVPTGAILVTLLLLTAGIDGATAGIKLEVVLVGA